MNTWIEWRSDQELIKIAFTEYGSTNYKQDTIDEARSEAEKRGITESNFERHLEELANNPQTESTRSSAQSPEDGDCQRSAALPSTTKVSTLDGFGTFSIVIGILCLVACITVAIRSGGLVAFAWVLIGVICLVQGLFYNALLRGASEGLRILRHIAENSDVTISASLREPETPTRTKI